MSLLTWTIVLLAVTFGAYLLISWRALLRESKGFYVAGRETSPIAIGMATAADWMSAATFMSVGGLFCFSGYSAAPYIMGWTGGYLLLVTLLAPYLRKLGRFTVPDFVGDRYYSDGARLAAVVSAVIISFLYLCGQLRGVAVVLSRCLEVEMDKAVFFAAVVVLLYAVLGRMRGITWTQVAQYIVMIVSFLIPAVMMSVQLTGSPVPQFGLGGILSSGPEAGRGLLSTLDAISSDMGLGHFTAAFEVHKKSMLDIFCITAALMVGTAGLPHVIVRFYTMTSVSAARWSAAYALLFIAVLYTTIPVVGAFALYNTAQSLDKHTHADTPAWVVNWGKTGLVVETDAAKGDVGRFREGADRRGQVLIGNQASGEKTGTGEGAGRSLRTVSIDPDIMVLASAEMASLPVWVIALLFVGALTAAMSTASGMLLVIGSAVAHDLYYRVVNPRAPERKQLLIGRIAVVITVIAAGFCALHLPVTVAQVVAYAFNLAAASFFPAIVLGLFWRRTTREGAVAGMVTGMVLTGIYIGTVGFLGLPPWFLGISAEGIGAVGMLVNLVVTVAVSRCTPEPPTEVQELIELVRTPATSQAVLDTIIGRRRV